MEKNEIKINLIDNAFSHMPPERDGVGGFKPDYFSWNRNWDINNQITVFTEDYIYSNMPNIYRTKYNVGWLLETRELFPSRYENIENSNKNLDFILTHDKKLLEKYPEKTKFVPFGGCWIDKKNKILQPKRKMISMIFSNKTFVSGHALRHEIYKNFNNGLIDFYGSGCNNQIKMKDDAIKDYAFSIVIENSKTENYFTEKLIDCFSYGTVPIYWGAKNIEKFFHINSILTFDTLEDLEKIISNISFELYNDLYKSLKINFNRSNDYCIPENWIYNNIFKDLYTTAGEK